MRRVEVVWAASRGSKMEGGGGEGGAVFWGRSWWAVVWDLRGTTALLLCVCSLTLP